MDFETDIREEVLKWLPFDRMNSKLVTELTDMRVSDLLIWFFNWLNRMPHPHPRSTHLSKECVFRKLPAREQVFLEVLRERIETGDYLASSLSRAIGVGYDGRAGVGPKKNLARHRSLDLLLNDWGIHHLHLSNVVEPDGFVQRGGLLLFAIFRDRAAFLLDVLPHGVWTEDRLVEIAVRNWPNERLFAQLNVLGLSERYGADDKKKLRAVGINSPIVVDNKVYVPVLGGMSTAGTTSTAAIKAASLCRELSQLEENLQKNSAYLRPQIESLGHVYPHRPEFKVTFVRTDHSWMFGVREMVTGSILRVNILGG